MRIISYLAVGLLIGLLRRLVAGAIECAVLLLRCSLWLLGWLLGAAASIMNRVWRVSRVCSRTLGSVDHTS